MFLRLFAKPYHPYCLALLGLSPVSALADLKQTLDWVPFHQLTQEQQQQLTPGSCGAYISPIKADNSLSNLSEAPLETSSNRSELVEKDGYQHITLLGDVIIKQGYRQLLADQATYNEQSDTITIDGELTVREPDLLLLADRGTVQQSANTLVIDNATYVIHSAHIRGTSQQLAQEQHIIRLEKGEFTHCAPGNNDWALKGSKITINTETRQGVATNVRLTVKDIPVFYWPYLRFPVGDERMSGFLYPVIQSSGGGTDISIPYYFNLAPNYDLTLTPHFIEQHGVLLEANGRHLSESFDTKLNVAHLSDDKGELSESEQSALDNGTQTADEINAFTGEDRWMVNLDQSGGRGKPWFTKIDYNEVSDIDYLEDFDSGTLNRNNEISLVQQIQFGYRFDNWDLTVNNQQYQILSNTVGRPFKELPRITLNGNYYAGDWNLALENEFTRFDHSDSDLPNNTTIVGNRLRLKHSLGLEKEYDAGFFRPRVQAQHLQYQLDERPLSDGANNTPSVSVAQAVVDSGLIFERDGSGYLQTFEPRLFYFYSPHRDQANLTGTGENINFDTGNTTFSYSQLFSDTRFSGSDRIDDANQISLGLTTRFIGNETGQELFSASIGKAFYLNERSVTLDGSLDTDNNSPIAANFNASLGKNWKLTNNTIYDDDRDRVDDNNLFLKYRHDDGTLFNLGHRFLRSEVSSSTVEQAEASIIQPLASNSWTLVAHARYDYTNNREIERLLGFEYHSCCYRARLAFQRFLDDDQLTGTQTNLVYDTGVVLEFQFIGLGGTGKQFDKLLTDTIDGYEQWYATHRQNP